MIDTTPKKPSKFLFIFDILLVLIILGAAYFRSVGLNWDDSQHLHPDERFLTMVETGITPVKGCNLSGTSADLCPNSQKDWLSFSEYFDTAASTLNPNNRGYGFYVYGTLPIFIVRYAAELFTGLNVWATNSIAQNGADGVLGSVLKQVASSTIWTGYDQVHLVGRQLSALSDIITIVLLYIIVVHVYNRKIALLAAILSALAVLQIQLSHFFTVETFTNVFIFLAIYFAVRIATAENLPRYNISQESKHPFWALVRQATRDHLLWNTLGFGLAYGMALASKINAFPLAILLPGAFALLYLQIKDRNSNVEKNEQILEDVVSQASEKISSEDIEQQAEIKVSQSSNLSWHIISYLLIGGAIAFLAFRVFQPYAFKGEYGFFDIRINEIWLNNIREQRAQASGNVDFPPALQWANRSIFFSVNNMIIWGLGLATGLCAFAGVFLMGLRMLQGEWKKHILLWGWTVFYLAWQTIQWNPTMRYQMPVYPLMAMMAAWFLFELGKIKLIRDKKLPLEQRPRPISLQPLAWILGVFVLAFSLAWAYAFIQIYERPQTRVAASRWIFQNVPGPVNLLYQGDNGKSSQQPLSFPYNYSIFPESPFDIGFTAIEDGIVDKISINRIIGLSENSGGMNLQAIITLATDDSQLTSAEFNAAPDGNEETTQKTVVFEQPVLLSAAQEFRLNVTSPDILGEADLCAPVHFIYQLVDGSGGEQVVAAPDPCTVTPVQPYSVVFSLPVDGTLNALMFDQAVSSAAVTGPQKFAVTLSVTPDDANTVMAQGSITADFGDPANQSNQIITLDRPATLEKGKVYFLRMQTSSGGPITLLGAAPINESSWDDGLPLRMDGLDPYGGIYQGDLNLEMYWDDNPDKLRRFTQDLDAGDYLFISSDRQWGTTTRVPERYPLTIKFYRELLGCPADKDIIWCYNVAKPGEFSGNLGYELVQVFESFPQIGNFSVNDQFAEEAFTVYDHPKVLIFKKNKTYDSTKVHEILGSVDLSKVVHVMPLQANKYPAGYMLPRVCGALPRVCAFFWANELIPLTEKNYDQSDFYGIAGLLSAERLEANQAGGTWSLMFDYAALQNAYPALGIILWLFTFFILGVFTYPILRWTLPGLADKGYPLARLAGLVIWAYFSWISASYGAPFTRVNVVLSYLIVIFIGAILAYQQRNAIKEEVRQKGKYFLLIEVLFLSFFMIDLFIRLGNPDLWHPWKGGERPMDFSYLNAVLRTTTFPPYDPWFAGGYVNYYYYGYVFIAMPIKFLGIVPSIAYNMVLPTLFSLLAMGGFSVAWNLVGGYAAAKGKPEAVNPLTTENQESEIESAVQEPLVEIPLAKSSQLRLRIPRFNSLLIAGISAAIGLVLIGNLGIPKMIYLGLARLGSPADTLENSTVVERILWSVKGLPEGIANGLPYGIGDWYWNPSRILPPTSSGGEITEFPLFTFIYSDLHAHMIALPVTLLALSWALSILLARGKWSGPGAALAGFVLGGLVIGSLRPTNTWDYPTYFALGLVATTYAIFKYKDVESLHKRIGLPTLLLRGLYALGGAALLVFFVLVLYHPFAEWFGQGYNSLLPWKGSLTPMSSYLAHWGVFLFVIVSWMTWETVDWMKKTPASALRTLRNYLWLIWIVFFALLIAMFIIGIVKKVDVALLALPLGLWASILLLRPGIGDAKRATLFMIGSGLFLTIMVELYAVSGDRMNTIFKFYVQVWVLFAVSAAASLAWLLAEIKHWNYNLRNIWEVILSLLVAGAAMFLFIGGGDKIRDRIAPDIPFTIDSMTYMLYSHYNDGIADMDLSQDYRAIRWLQENVKGSPVVLEAAPAGIQYSWFSRISIYTGLPTVVGWQYHQEQQRALFTQGVVAARGLEAQSFYRNNDDIAGAIAFLKKYNVRYIVVGQQERNSFPDGLAKFDEFNGQLWNEVYRDANTVIYEVLP